MHLYFGGSSKWRCFGGVRILRTWKIAMGNGCVCKVLISLHMYKNTLTQMGSLARSYICRSVHIYIYIFFLNMYIYFCFLNSYIALYGVAVNANFSATATLYEEDPLIIVQSCPSTRFLRNVFLLRWLDPIKRFECQTFYGHPTLCFLCW